MNVAFVSVMACNDFGGGPWSDWMTFVVSPDTPPADAPVISSPTGTIYTASPAFTWTSVSGGVSYWLDVYDTTDSTAVFGWFSVSGASPVTLTAGHSYCAQVMASNDFGAGPSSALVYFIASLPAAPVVTAPTGNNNDVAPWFNWAAVTGADYYWLTVTDVTSNGNNVVYDAEVDALPVAPVTLEWGHSYSAVAKAHNDFGWSELSDQAVFGVYSLPLPEDQNVTAEVGGAVAITLTASGGSGEYEFIPDWPAHGTVDSAGPAVTYTPDGCALRRRERMVA